MDRYRLKNIIILILVLMDLFLLGSLASRQASRQTARRTAVQQLVELFAADGIQLAPSAISQETPPSSRTLTRDVALERQVAAVLLGNDLSRSDQGGGISTYSSARGAAMFRSTGGFDAAGTLAQEDVMGCCREVCRNDGYSAPASRLDSDGGGTATVTRLYDDVPVFNCTVTFSISHGVLNSVSGTLLPDTFTETASDVTPLSATAALTAFQKVRRDTGAAVSAITDMYCCFELQSSASVHMSLVPAWCIVTDTGNYYVNCITSAVTAS